MSQTYLNSPSMGCAISAEEWANQSTAAPSCCARGGTVPPTTPSCCACGGTATTTPSCCACGETMPPATPDCPDDGCGQSPVYCQQMVCCCHPVSAPTRPQPPQVDEGCCCKQSFRAALSLLCDQQISSLLDFDLSAFLTNTYVAGATLGAVTAGTPSDNLSDTLSGSFQRFSPGSCDLIDVDAPVYTAAGGDSIFTAAQVSLCQLDAVVIQGAVAEAEGDLSAEQVAARNFRCLRTRLARRLNPCGSDCGQNCRSCACDCRDCCCAAGLLDALAQNNLSRRVSLLAGLLALETVTLLGTVGNVLVLANDEDRRLYFVCVNSVQFIG